MRFRIVKESCSEVDNLNLSTQVQKNSNHFGFRSMLLDFPMVLDF